MLAQRLQHEAFDAFYASDLRRAAETAAAIATATGRQPLLTPALRERYLGCLQVRR